MHDNEPTDTGNDENLGALTVTDAAPEADIELQRVRKLRVMAAVSAPVLMSLLMSKRANAWSPPPDPDAEP